MKKQAKDGRRKPQRKKAPSPVRKSTRREPPPEPVTIAPADQVVIAPSPEPALPQGRIVPPGTRMRIGNGEREHIAILPKPERMQEQGAPALDDPDRVSGFEEE